MSSCNTPGSDESPKTKKEFIIEEIEKSGYPLESYISGILRDQKWSVFPNQYYYDKDSGKGREFDIRAEKEYFIDELDSLLVIRLLIECKKIPGNAWIFFKGPQLQSGSITSFPAMVTILDAFGINSRDATAKIRVPLLFGKLHYDKGFFASGYKEIVLDRKQSKKSDISNIWESEITLIKTIPSEIQDCLSDELMVVQMDDLKTDGFDSWHSSGAPQRIHFLYPLIVFQGDIYSTSFPLSEENLKEIDYVCLNRDYKSAEYEFNGTIDILKKKYFEKYLVELEKDFRKIKQSTISNWGKFIDKEKDLLQLLEVRDQQLSGVSHHLSNSYKNIDANENDFQSVVLAPKLGLQSRLTFNNTLDNDLRKASDVVHHWNDIKRAPHKIEFFSKTRDGMKLAYAQIFSDGRVTYQEPTNLKEKALYYSRPLQFLKRCIEAAEKVYPIFGYHGEIEVGLSINGVNNVKLEFPSRILVREGGNICEIPMIYIQRTIDLRELDMLHEIFKSIFNEYCRWFDLSWDDDTITLLISELYPLARS